MHLIHTYASKNKHALTDYKVYRLESLENQENTSEHASI